MEALTISQKFFSPVVACGLCCDALGARNHHAESNFLRFKDRGGLFKPTQSVIRVCVETERSFQRMIGSNGGKLPQGNNSLKVSKGPKT